MHESSRHLRAARRRALKRLPYFTGLLLIAGYFTLWGNFHVLAAAVFGLALNGIYLIHINRRLKKLEESHNSVTRQRDSLP